MAPRITAVVGLTVLLALPLGCGSSGTDVNPPGPGPAPPSPGATFDIGPMQVTVAAAAGFKTLTLESTPSAPVGFTVLYGSEIVQLREMGYGLLAFDGPRDGALNEIFTIGADGSQRVALTTNSLADDNAAWSPDGSKIAFTRERPGGNKDICVMNADGSGAAYLTNDPTEDDGAAWSPDGAQIAFHSSRTGDMEVWVMDADGTHETQLSNDPTADDGGPDWSPDGKQIAYTHIAPGGVDVYVMNPDGSGATPLTTDPAADAQPVWSPDGSKILFMSARGGTAQLYRMNPDGSIQSPVTHDPLGAQHPDWSPDGQRIAYQVSRGISTHDIVIDDANGLGPHNITASGTDEEQPAWCPVPTPLRTLIGAAGSDGGSNPPFGTSKPLAIVGLTEMGMASATTIGVGTPRWPTIKVATLRNLGGGLAGAKITASKINQVREDMGRGMPVKVWDVDASPNTGAILVFFSTSTGKVTSVIPTSDVALSAADEIMAEREGSRIILRGEFLGAYDARNPQRNLASGPVTQVTLDARTGEVVSAS